MSLSTLKPVTFRIPPVTGGNGSKPNASKVTLVNRQALSVVKVHIESMKEKEQPVLQESSTVSSRREMMHLTALSLCFASLFFPEIAEARPRNATTKQKITGKFEELKEKAGLSKPKLDELKGKAGELKEKAGLSSPKLDELKGKAGELKEKAGLSKPKLEELKEKLGLSKPKDEGRGNEPKYNEAEKSKPTNEMYGSNAKSKDAVPGTNLGDTSQQTPSQAPQKAPSVPTLPTLPPHKFLIGQTVETSVS